MTRIYWIFSIHWQMRMEACDSGIRSTVANFWPRTSTWATIQTSSRSWDKTVEILASSRIRPVRPSIQACTRLPTSSRRRLLASQARTLFLLQWVRPRKETRAVSLTTCMASLEGDIIIPRLHMWLVTARIARMQRIRPFNSQLAHLSSLANRHNW